MLHMDTSETDGVRELNAATRKLRKEMIESGLEDKCRDVFHKILKDSTHHQGILQNLQKIVNNSEGKTCKEIFQELGCLKNRNFAAETKDKSLDEVLKKWVQEEPGITKEEMEKFSEACNKIIQGEIISKKT